MNALSDFEGEIMNTKPTTIVVTLRLPEAVHALLKEAAARQTRSMANFVRKLIVDHCVANGIGVEKPKSGGKRRTLW